jgi:hypothetical protein
VAGEFDQIKPAEVGQTLIAQKNIKRLHSLEHLLQGAIGTVGGGQLGETITLKQVLSRPELEGMVFHYQYAQIVFEHRSIHASSVELKEARLFREVTE